tara:strand:+ start:403 stop:1068 length:666 start_codon:yes stop_codon:yes gene_type:complete
MAISKFNYNSFNVTPVAGKALSFNSDGDGFSTASSSSMVLIKTLTASADSTISFVDGASSVVLDSTYPVYLFKFINIHLSVEKEFRFNLSADTGSNYNVTKTSTNFRSYHFENDSAAAVAYEGAYDLAQGTGVQTFSQLIGTDNDSSGCGELYLFNPSSTTFVKHYISKFTHYYTSAAPGNIVNYVSGYGNTTSAVDAVQFSSNTGNIASGTIKLYGIKDS